MKYNKEVYRSLTLILQFGINMLVPIFICALIGYYLDKLFGTSFCFVTAFFIGALAGFTNVFKMARSIYSKPAYKDTANGEITYLKSAKDNGETAADSGDSERTESAGKSDSEDEFSVFDKLAGLSKTIDNNSDNS